MKKSVYVLRYQKGKYAEHSDILGLYSTFEDAQIAGERTYKNITGRKEFYWNEDYVDTVLFDGKNGETLMLRVTKEN